MSVEAITWALKQPVPRPLAKFVLVMLANLAGPDKRGNVVAWPSIKYLRDSTGMDRKTVQAALLLLREAGLIEDLGERVGATGSVIVYRLNCGPDLFTKRAQKESTPKNGAAPKTAGSSPVSPPKQSQKRDTDTKRPVFTQSTIEKSPEAKARRRACEGSHLTAIADLLKGATA
jgi:DNA-binding transcriptional ArsR family regulator